MSSEGSGVEPAAPKALFPPSELAAVEKRLQWKRWVGGTAAVLVAIAWFLQPITQHLVLANGRTFDVISLNRHTSYTINPSDGTTSNEYGLKLIYYTGLRDAERLKTEAGQVATGVLPIADSLDMRLIWIQAARAIGPRFTTITYSRTYRYDRDSTGAWRGPNPSR